jgi:predicted alpha/beta-hydrolase family hydrolase
MSRRRRGANGAGAVDAVALWPGAGSSSEHPALAAIEAALAPLPVARIDFPYRREGRRAPDRAPKLVASIVEEVGALCRDLGTSPERVVLGGRSMGGRMCSMAIAEGLGAAGLVLLAYPLHTPGKPERLRTEHLPQVAVPTLFVSGDRDPFGAPEELAAAQELVAGPVTAVTVEGGRHELKGADEQVATVVADWVRSLGPAARPAG